MLPLLHIKFKMVSWKLEKYTCNAYWAKVPLTREYLETNEINTHHNGRYHTNSTWEDHCQWWI